MSSRHAFAVKHALVVMTSVLVSVVAVRAESGADAWITMQAQSSLSVAEGTLVSAVVVDTRNGYVTLHGKVKNQRVKSKAAEDVRRVRGVLGVRNLLQIVATGHRARIQRSDDAVKADVQRVLSTDPSLDDSRITVRSVSNGVVLLSGETASLNDDIRALRTTADRPGVRRVFSEIEAASAPRLDLVTTEDDVIRRDVTSALGHLNARGNAGIRVVVVDGVVWLNGSVPTWDGNSSRLYAVRSVTGVRSIMNSLRVDPPLFRSR